MLCWHHGQVVQLIKERAYINLYISASEFTMLADLAQVVHTRISTVARTKNKILWTPTSYRFRFHVESRVMVSQSAEAVAD
jgi:hypothetical protein